MSSWCSGREFEVRLLSGNERDGTWGTSEFEARVNAMGVVRNVKVQGKELIWQAAALYTSPVPPGGNEGIRVVQGEGSGERGLSVEPPTMECQADRGRRVWTFRHLVSSKKALEGQPLCEVIQKIAMTPTGEIEVTYDCHWLTTLRWHGFSLLMMFAKETIVGRDYVAFAGERALTGILSPSAPGEKRLREELSQLTIRAEVGPFHFMFDAPCKTSLDWGASVQLQVSPKVVPYRGIIDKGSRDRIAYRILLPVSQQ